MSRAFVKEGDGGEPLPELSVSPHPNWVTPAGLQQIESRVAALEEELRAARAAEDPPLVARVQRDLRYWAHRRGSARVVPVATGAPDTVRFGAEVVVRFDDGTERGFRLVGEDEADPARGLVSWVAPIARALSGKAIGDEILVQGRTARIHALRP